MARLSVGETDDFRAVNCSTNKRLTRAFRCHPRSGEW
jgi:hypothetical protein